MPAVARKDGADIISTGHGCDATTVTNEGSSNVFVNTIGVVRYGDLEQIHLVPAGDCVPHVLTLSSCSQTVYVNGLGAGRLGDVYGGEVLITGSETVFFGD